MAQNQLDRAEVRKSKRAQARPGGDGRKEANLDNILLQRQCQRGGVVHKKQRRVRGRQAQANVLPEEGEDMQPEREVEDERWELRQTPAYTVNARASEAISNLSTGAVSNLSDTSSWAWISSMKELVEGHGWTDENGAFFSNSLQSLINRCKRSLEVASGVEFITMMNMLQLAAKSDR